MFRVLFLILVVFSSLAFAQNRDNSAQKEKSESYILFEFDSKTDDKKLQEIADVLMNKLAEKPLRGFIYIISYGSETEVRKSERRLVDFLYDRKKHGTGRMHNLPLITFVNGGDDGENKSVIWIVPEGAEPPKP